MKSLIPEAKENLENCKELLREADCLKTDARNLREDIEHSKDNVDYLQARALETICGDVRLGKNNAFYCANSNECPYKGDSVRIAAAGGNSFVAPVCGKAYDNKKAGIK